MIKPLDHETLALAWKEREILGEAEAVVICTCPRCGWWTLVWSGRPGDRWRCMNRRCNLDYATLADLLAKEEAVREKKRREIEDLMKAPVGTYERRHGAIRQVRHG